MSKAAAVLVSLLIAVDGLGWPCKSSKSSSRLHATHHANVAEVRDVKVITIYPTEEVFRKKVSLLTRFCLVALLLFYVAGFARRYEDAQVAIDGFACVRNMFRNDDIWRADFKGGSV